MSDLVSGQEIVPTLSAQSAETPWRAFDSLVEGLADLHQRSKQAASRSVDSIPTQRNWMIGTWIIAFEQDGADRAQYGEGLLDALSAAFKARQIKGLSTRILRNYR